MDQNKDALLDRIRAIEAARRGRGKHRSENASYMHRMQKRRTEAKAGTSAGIERRCESGGKDFRMIINEASPMLRTYLKKARLSAGEGNRLLIVLPDELSASAVATPGT